jgi:hypothetical protein
LENSAAPKSSTCGVPPWIDTAARILLSVVIGKKGNAVTLSAARLAALVVANRQVADGALASEAASVETIDAMSRSARISTQTACRVTTSR